MWSTSYKPNKCHKDLSAATEYVFIFQKIVQNL